MPQKKELKKNTFYLGIKALILSLILTSSLYSYEVNTNGEFQVWIYDSFLFPLKKNVKLNLENEFRFGDHASVLYQYYLQARLIVPITKRFDIAPGYRQEFSKESPENIWRKRYNPLIDFTFHWKVMKRKWLITNRNRVQYFIREHDPNEWQYRNRLQFESTYKMGGLNLKPLIFEEIFFRERLGFSENRVAVGGARCLWDKSSIINLLYMLRHRKRDDEWTHQHIFFLRFYFSF